MQSLVSSLQEVFGTAIREAFPTVGDVAVSISKSKPEFGDFQCNNAMGLFKKNRAALGECQSPKEVADAILAKVDQSTFKETTVSPQGFITVRLSEAWLGGRLQPFIHAPFEYKVKNGRCVIDFSSPNIAKEMHVGHLRSTILGQAISKCLEFSGVTVEKRNHLGDWGTQFGMLIEYMREVHPDFLTNPPELTELCAFYKASKKRFDEDAEFKKRAQMQVVSLQSGDEFATEAWKLFCRVSEQDFQQIYDRLNVDGLVARGESFYNDMIPAVVEELADKIEVSDGAKCFFVDNYPKKKKGEVPLMVVKSDGGYGYDSTDLAAVKFRLSPEGENCNWAIYVTDMGQEAHFKKVFKAAEIVGWHEKDRTRLDHVGFGLVQGSDGKKFKTRSGDTVKLTDLLDEARDRAIAEIEKRSEEGADPAAAQKIGYSAVKYFDLKQNRTTNYRFSFDAMLDPKGNTAVYLLYAYARICSIFRKAEVDPSTLKVEDLEITHPEERKLAVLILSLPDLMDLFLKDLAVHRLCEFCYDLSTQFSDFYRECRVVGSPEQNSRLILCHLTKKMLATVFDLVGIEPLERI